MARRYACAPCPFCGAEDDDNDIVFNEFGDSEGECVQIACCRCGATGPMVRGPMIGRCTEKQNVQAVALWNERGA